MKPSPTAVSSSDHVGPLLSSSDQFQDLSLFETTSKSAARALAIQQLKDAFPEVNQSQIDLLDYQSLLESELIVQSSERDWNGKAVYQVRPNPINLPILPSIDNNNNNNNNNNNTSSTSPNLTFIDSNDYNVNIISLATPETDRTPTSTHHSINPIIDSPYSSPTPKIIRSYKSTPQLLLLSLSSSQSTPALLESTTQQLTLQSNFTPVTISPDQMGFYSSPNQNSPSQSKHNQSPSFNPDRSLRGSVSDMKLRNKLDQQQKQSLSKQAYKGKHNHALHPVTSSAHTFSKDSLRDADVLGKILGWRTSTAIRNNHPRQNATLPMKSNFSSSNLPTTMKIMTKARSNTTTNVNHTTATSDFGSFHPHMRLSHTEPLPATLLASPTQSHHSKSENQEANAKDYFGDNQFTSKFPSNTLIRSQTQKRVPKPSLKPIVPFGNGVKLYRNHTTNPTPNVARSIKKSLSSDDIHRLRQDSISAWNPAQRPTDRPSLSDAPHTTPPPNLTFLLRSPDDTTPTSALHRASLPAHFPANFDLDSATRGTLSAAKRRRTMHGAASNESIRTARPSPQQRHHEIHYPFPPSRKPRFQDISIFDLFNQSAIPSYSNLPSPVGFNSPSANSMSAARDQIGCTNTSAHQITVIAQPGDDPRYVIWGEQQDSNKASVPVTKKRSSSIVERQQTYQSSISSTSNLTHIGNSNSSKSSDVGGAGSSVYNVRRWSRSARHQPPNSSGAISSNTNSFGHSSSSIVHDGSQSPHRTSSHSTLTEEGTQSHPKRSSLGSRAVPTPALQRILMAATIERWVAELTTRIDPRALGDFFFTYRNVMKPIDLCMLLTSRFEWTILFKCRYPSTSLEDENDECLDIWGRKVSIDAQEEAGRRIVKVRTFVMIRQWLLNHFEDDFLQDRALRFRLTSWLKNLIQKIKSIRQCLLEIDPKTKSKGDEDLKILKSLKNVVKQRKDVYLAYNLVLDNNDRNRNKHRDVRDVFGQGESEKKARDSNLAKSDLRLNDGDASEDQATDDEDVEVDVKGGDDELLDSDSIRVRYEKLKECFAQETHEILEPEPNTADEINVKFDRAPLFIGRKSTVINATLAHVPTHSMNNSGDTLDHRASHVRPIDPLGFTQQHNPIQRYFTSTMGTFGRFKRMINNRSGTANATGPYTSMSDSSRFNDHVESNGEVCDLLCAKGGLERFMSFFEGDHQFEQSGPERLEEIAEDKESRYSRRFETEDCPSSFEKTNLENERLSMDDTGKCSIEIEKTSWEIDRGHLSSPLIQDDEDGFESQLSLSSSTSNTSCTTSSQPYSSDEKGTEGLVALVGSEAIEFLDSKRSSLALSFGMVQDEKDEIDTRRFGSRPQSLHESLSTETIKSESNRTSKGVGTGLFKKQIKKRFANQNLGSMRILSRQSLGLDRTSTSMSRDSMSLDRPSLSVEGGRESSSSRDNLSLRSSRLGTGPQDISVQLDDLDLSDDDGSDSDQHNENHRPLRRLRAAGDLKEAINSTRRSFFAQLKPSLRLRVNSGVRLSTETSSSIGTRRVPSIAGSIFRKSKLGDSVNSLPDTLNSHQSGTEAGEEEEEEEAGGIGVVANFVAEGLDSDEDEPGDVEAALRRLEGVIDADREREKARKVERQMMKSLEASRTGNRSRSSTIDSHRTFSSSSSLSVVTDEEGEQDEDEEEGEEEEEEEGGEMEMMDGEHDIGVDKASTPTVPEITFDHVAERDSGAQEEHRSSEERSGRPKFMNSSKESVNSHGGAGNDLWKRKHKKPTASELNGSQQAMDRKIALHRRFVGGSALSRPMSLFGGAGGAQPPIHRSFLLDFRTEILAQQFALIERDLLRKITWQELLMSRWQENGGSSGALNDTNCWTSYMKQRVIEGKSKSENVRGLIVRFNLTCNWVASELVMTVGLEERVRLLGKLIRLAFKCYRQNNFQTLTQIIHGLQTPYITRLKRTWAKLGIWESRMFRDLKEFTSHSANFKSLRLVQDQLVECIESVGGTTARVTTTAGHDDRVGVVGCIPFLGLYLRDLTINDELPTYLNPNEPSIGVPTIDPESGFVEGTKLYPLVNIHKFRIYSKVVNKIIGFQELSLTYPFEAQGDQSLFLNCLRLKSLDSARLRWLSDVCEGG